MKNAERLQEATDAIDNLFSDTSVSRSKCRENLEELQSQIEMKLDALAADDARDENSLT